MLAKLIDHFLKLNGLNSHSLYLQATSTSYQLACLQESQSKQPGSLQTGQPWFTTVNLNIFFSFLKYLCLKYKLHGHLCWSGPLRSRHQDGITCARTILGEITLNEEMGRSWIRLGEPGNSRDGGQVEASKTTEQPKDGLARKSGSSGTRLVIMSSRIEPASISLTYPATGQVEHMGIMALAQMYR